MEDLIADMTLEECSEVAAEEGLQVRTPRSSLPAAPHRSHPAEHGSEPEGWWHSCATSTARWQNDAVSACPRSPGWDWSGCARL